MELFTVIHDARPPSFVTAGEISRNFGLWQEKAGAGPVVVTHHGRPRVVMMSAEQYELGEVDPPRAAVEADHSPLLLNHISEAFLALDPDLRIVGANTVFNDYVGRAASQLLGRPWVDVFPEVAGSPQEELCRRVLRTGQAARLEEKCTVLVGRTFVLHAFPFRDGVAVLISDKTSDVEAERRQASGAALAAAVAATPGLSAAELNPRGMLVDADERFVGLTGFARDALLRIRLADLVLPRYRPAMLDAIDAAMTKRTTVTLPTVVLGRDGAERIAQFSLAPIIQAGEATGLRVCALAFPG